MAENDWFDLQWKLKNKQEQIINVTTTDKTNWDAKAPGGYGLGVPLSGTTLSDCNLGNVTGMYYFPPSALNKPTTTDGVMFVMAYSPSYITQMVSGWNYTETYTRSFNSAVWSTWVKLVTQPSLDTQLTTKVNTITTRLGGGVDLNTIKTNGWYDIAAPINGPTGIGSWFNMIVICSFDANYLTQMGFDMVGTSTSIYTRKCTGGTWGAWVVH